MIYRRHGIIAGLLFSLARFIVLSGAAVCCAIKEGAHNYLVLPLVHFIRASPVAATFSLLPRFKIAAFRVIENLKPVYRDSYETNGLSLSSHRN